MLPILLLVAWGAGGCASAARRSAGETPVDAVSKDGTVVPTRYSAGRFFALPVLARGDTASLFLDTAAQSAIWEPFLPWLEVQTAGTFTGPAGKTHAFTRFPALSPGTAFPAPPARPPANGGMVVAPADPNEENNFVAWIAHESQGQLGGDWFDGHAWTFDYPGHRLVLHDPGYVVPESAGRELPLHFAVDSAGHRAGSALYTDAVVDGETVTLLVDTGATIWLSADALARVADGGPAERASSHIWLWQYTKWHEAHPDWPVIEHASLYHDLTLICVPTVSIAGYDVGPVWFSVWPIIPKPPQPPPTAPAWRSRVGGTIGGSLLQYFVVTLDYPHAVARVRRGRTF